MIRKNRTSHRRTKRSLQGRSLQFESMEGRLVLSASGFASNECAPELNDALLDTIVPTANFSPGAEIAFDFDPTAVVTDAGEGATDPSDINFILDPDVEANFRNNGATPVGATLTFDDQGTADTADDRYDFSWTPTEMQQGTFRLFIIATDLGGTGGPSNDAPIVPLSDVYAFEVTIDDQPTVDLNGDDDSGIDFGPVAFTEGDSAVSVVDTDLSIPFVSNDMVASATIEIANPQADGLEELGITPGTLDLDASTPGRLVLSVTGGGLADKSVFETALQSLTYVNTSDDPVAQQMINVTINDGSRDSAVAVATVDITATNDRPDLLQIEAPANALVGQEYVLDLVADDPDGGDLLVFQIQLGPDSAVITPNAGAPAVRNTIQVARDPNDGRFHAQIVWTPSESEGDNSPVLFRVSVTDTGGSADSEDYSITIENQPPVANDDPTADNDPFAVGEDDGATNVGNILANDSDADGDDFSINSVDGNSVSDPINFTTAKGADVSIAADGTLTYDPNGQFESLGAGETGTDTFTYTLIDSEGNVSNEATVTVTINGENDAPTTSGNNPSFAVNEDAGDTPLDTSLILNEVMDVDANDMLTIVGVERIAGSEGGIFTVTDGALSFNPDGDFDVDPGSPLSFPFDVVVEDSQGESVQVRSSMTINPVNEAPVAVDDPAVGSGAYTTDEETTLNATSVLANDTDDGGATLSVAQVNGSAANVDATITVSDGDGREGTLTVNGTDGTFTFVPSNDFNSLGAGQSSTVTFTYIADDGSAENNLSNQATVTITITGLNDPPVANNDDGPAFTTDEDTELTGANILGNDDDADGDPLMVSQVNGNAGDVDTPLTVTSTGGHEGTLTVAPNGLVTFEPSDDFDALAQDAIDTVMFNYTAFDGLASSVADGVATITVTGVNDGPTIDLSELAAALQTALGLGSPPDVTQPIEVPENVAFGFDFSSVVSDPDTPISELGFSRSDTVPGDLNQPTIDGDGQFSWTPNANATPQDIVFTLSAIDSTVPDNVVSSSVQLTFRVVTVII